MADGTDWTKELLDGLEASPTPGGWYVLLTTSMRDHVQSISNDINNEVGGLEHLPAITIDPSSHGCWPTRVRFAPRAS